MLVSLPDLDEQMKRCKSTETFNEFYMNVCLQYELFWIDFSAGDLQSLWNFLLTANSFNPVIEKLEVETWLQRVTNSRIKV